MFAMKWVGFFFVWLFGLLIISFGFVTMGQTIGVPNSYMIPFSGLAGGIWSLRMPSFYGLR